MERVLMKLEDLIYDQLESIVKQKDISPVELENATKAVCLLLKVRELEENSSMESSVKGHYSNNYTDGMYITPIHGRGYYRYEDDRYSRHSVKDRAIDRLERMIDEAKSESEKESIKKMIVGLEYMELY